MRRMWVSLETIRLKIVLQKRKMKRQQLLQVQTRNSNKLPSKRVGKKKRKNKRGEKGTEREKKEKSRKFVQEDILSDYTARNKKTKRKTWKNKLFVFIFTTLGNWRELFINDFLWQVSPSWGSFVVQFTVFLSSQGRIFTSRTVK